MTSTSFWQTDLNISKLSHLTQGPLQGQKTADVAIIGAGVTGAAAALWLARAGIRVSIVEGRQIAAGASGRNGGFLANGTTQSYAATIERFGRQKARQIWAYTVQNHEQAAAFIAEMEEHGWSCGYHKGGSLKLAASGTELEHVRASDALLRADGWKVEDVARRDLPLRLRHAYYGGAYYPDNAVVQPARYVAGLAMLAVEAGATIYTESPVLSMNEQEHDVMLTTPQGTLQARHLILATNAWLPEIGAQLDINWLANCITPTRGQIIATEPVNEQIFPCSCSGDQGYQYWRQLEDGRLVIGGWRNQSFETENTLDETPGQEVQQHLDAFVHETLNLPQVQIESRWAGIMAFSADGLPLIGRLPGTQHCYISGGYTGHGNAYAIRAAYMLSELVQGRIHEDVGLFEVERFAR